MQVLMIRHSKTQGNEAHKYVGRSDQPLSENGIKLAQEAAEVYAGEFKTPEKVYVTPLIRTQMTAKILFPDAKQIVADGLREMDFGVFEDRSAAEMENDPEYSAWVEGMCEGRCPGGEKKSEFSERVCRAFAHIIDEEMQITQDQSRTTGNKDDKLLVMVLHGGTIISIAEKYALPKRDFYDIFLTNCQGMLFDVVSEGDELKLINEKTFFRNPGHKA